MVNPWFIVAALVAFGLTGSGCYLWGAKAERNAIEAKEARDAKVRAEVEAAAQLGAAKAISAIEVKNVTIRQNIERETRIVPDYTACHHSADGLRNLNSALTNQPLGSGELPRADTPR